MIIDYSLVSGPSGPAVSLNEVANAIRLDDLDCTNGGLTTIYATAATKFCEKFTGRAFLTQTWRATMPSFPLWAPNRIQSCFGSYSPTPGFYDPRIPLSRPPLQSVSSIVYTDTNGTQQTFTDFVADTKSYIPSVRPAYGKTWPTTQPETPDCVQVTYVCGYGDLSAIPEDLRVAIWEMAAHFFYNRQPVVMGKTVLKIPFSVESILYQYKVWGF